MYDQYLLEWSKAKEDIDDRTLSGIIETQADFERGSTKQIEIKPDPALDEFKSHALEELEKFAREIDSLKQKIDATEVKRRGKKRVHEE